MDTDERRRHEVSPRSFLRCLGHPRRRGLFVYLQACRLSPRQTIPRTSRRISARAAPRILIRISTCISVRILSRISACTSRWTLPRSSRRASRCFRPCTCRRSSRRSRCGSSACSPANAGRCPFGRVSRRSGRYSSPHDPYPWFSGLALLPKLWIIQTLCPLRHLAPTPSSFNAVLEPEQDGADGPDR